MPYDAKFQDHTTLGSEEDFFFFFFFAPVYSPRQTDIKWVEEDHPTLYLTNYKIYIYVQ